ncbi:hypothetical protein DKX38_026011 [Salix brachista]|uniref:Uncharacterized protein n=1 Tax=Salix brachista TaxID=2182728 RepID=A0A5N5JRB9_9ROSI|nr:hypothetical protein DKX38_026011 [Salix brachista]
MRPFPYITSLSSSSPKLALSPHSRILKTQRKMGNCLRHESQDFSGLDMKEKAMNDIDEEGLLGDNSTPDFTSCSSTTTSAASSTKVKIKISKKQLEELIGKVQVKELSVQQILSMLLMNGGGNDGSYDAHQLSWRPNLQSIPE